MAARLAGREPDEHATLEVGGVVAFDGPLWRYPDFLSRAETAYQVLVATRLVRPENVSGQSVSSVSSSECSNGAETMDDDSGHYSAKTRS